MHPHQTIMKDVLTFMLSVWGATGSALLIILALYRSEDKPNMLSFLGQFDGKLLIAGVIILLCSSTVATRYWLSLRRNGKRPLRMILIWNVLPLILTSMIFETTLRLLASETPKGTMLWGKPLAPRSLELFGDSSQVNRILSYDQTLGWIVRPNLRTSDGLYFTSAEGLRISNTGGRFNVGDTCRIALVGDSHTFGEELKVENTWGYLLQSYMPECQVLNFGVPGYSVGQMYLRYLRDVLPLRPDIVIFALSSDSAGRTMSVYGLNTMFSDGVPWAQPRFLLTTDGLEPINQPLPRLEEIVQTKWISNLPYIDYDWRFSPGKWELQRWRYLYNSYLFRLYTTQFPLWRVQKKGDSVEILNHALLRAFTQAVESHHSTPLVLYLPDKTDDKDMKNETPSLKILRSSGIDYLDLRPCLNQVPDGDRFIPEGGHYSLRGSERIAACIARRVSLLRKQVNAIKINR